MTIQIIPAGFYFPAPQSGTTLNPSALTIDAADEAVGGVMQAAKAGELAKVGFRTGTVTIGATILIRLETVGVDGFPTGTLLDVNSETTQAVVATTDNNTSFLVTLSATATVTKGQWFAVVIAQPSASAGNMQIMCGTAAQQVVHPYMNLLTASWAKQTNKIPMFPLEYNDASYASIPHAWPYEDNLVSTYNSGSTPDERALHFQVPFTMRVTGFWAMIDQDGDFDGVLYNVAGTALQTLSVDKDFRSIAGTGLSYFLFTGTEELAINTVYYLSIKPTSVTNLIVRQLVFASASYLDAMDGGTDVHLSTRTDAGAWTDVTDTIPMIGLILDGFDDAAGGGGGLIVHPGMSGGMRG